MPLQWRRKEPRAGRRDDFYSIERDLAYIGPDLARAAMHALEEEYYEEWFKQFFEEKGLKAEDLIEGVRKFGLAFNNIIKAKTPTDALAESGFSNLPYPVQMAFYCKLGQVFLAAIWSGVKDVSRPESDPPVTIEELLEDVCSIADAFHIGSQSTDKTG